MSNSQSPFRKNLTTHDDIMDNWIHDPAAYAAIADFTPQELDDPIARASPEVHPLLAYERWVGLSKADYLRFLPSLRMTTVAIECIHATHFWHAFLFGPQVPRTDLDDVARGSFSQKYPDSRKPLPFEEEQKVLIALKDLASKVTFHMRDEGSTAFNARTQPSIKGKGTDSQAGVRSQIIVNSTSCDILKRPNLKLRARQRRWFELGMNLVHEVAHALHYATHGIVPEMFFEEHIFAEMGQAINDWIFNGEVQRENWNTPKERLILAKMPDFGTIIGHEALSVRYPVSASVPTMGTFRRLSDDDVEGALILFYLEIEPGKRLTLGPGGLEVTNVN
ncbi:hypothetical protein HII31_11561 [Pseudocercospora fuligena]|uniref:Uncharacterized protein n=1 Tax=Pseudocercospora fuligena TaxID=685502 RepID=A0A8H6RAU4_9PEZI|nr:hypothetical protein HII31_11561 [Pseudocercospora fuligena]